MTLTAIEEVKRRLSDLPDLRNFAFHRHVLQRLSSGFGADLVWKQFGDDASHVGAVLSRVNTAFDLTMREYGRPPASHEEEDIQRVISLAKELKSAIRAIMPGDSVASFAYGLDAEGEPDILLELGWHSLRKGGYETGYPLAIADDVLEWTIEEAEKRRDGLPTRASVRPAQHDEGKSPEITMFIRHLDWQFRREFNAGKPTAIAHIATAIFDLKDNPLDAKDVEKRLRDSPLRYPT